LSDATQKHLQHSIFHLHFTGTALVRQ